MVLRHVERLEIVVVRFHVRPFGYVETEGQKNGADLFQGLRDGVNPTAGDAPPREGHIQLFPLQGLYFGFFPAGFQARLDPLGQFRLDGVRQAAQGGPVFRGNVLQVPEHLREASFPAEVKGPQGGDLIRRGRRFQGLQGTCPQRFELVPHSPPALNALPWKRSRKNAPVRAPPGPRGFSGPERCRPF